MSPHPFATRRYGTVRRGLGAVVVMGLALLVAACGATTTGGGGAKPTATPKPTATATPVPPCASWRIVSSPNATQYSDSALNSVSAVSSGSAWAVGGSHTDGIAEQSLIEQWDGSAWRPVANPANVTLFKVVAISANDVWALGYNITMRGEHAGGALVIEHWNGTTWSVTPSPIPSQNNAFLLGMTAVSSTDVWAVGQTYPTPDVSLPFAERWDGTTWQQVAGPALPGVTESLFYGVTRIPGTSQLWAVGYTLKGPRPAYQQPLIERWDGAAWRVVSNPALPAGSFAGALRGVVALSATDAWAVGDYTASDHTIRTLIAHWDGATWQVAASPDTWGTLMNVAAAGAHDVRAVGYASSGDGNTQHLLIQQWNGASWQTATGPEPANAAYSHLNDIAADGAGGFWAVGTFTIEGGGLQTLAEHCP